MTSCSTQSRPATSAVFATETRQFKSFGVNLSLTMLCISHDSHNDHFGSTQCIYTALYPVICTQSRRLILEVRHPYYQSSRLPVRGIGSDNSRKLRLPLVPIGEKFFCGVSAREDLRLMRASSAEWAHDLPLL